MTSRVELIRALGVLSESPTDEHRRLAALLDLDGVPDPESYAETFLFQLYPYASVYVGSEGMLGGEARDRVAGAWSALGRMPPSEPDHVGALLGLYAALVERGGEQSDAAERALWDAAAAGFLWEHILSWIMPYLSRFADAASPVYAEWARLLESVLVEEARHHGPPSALPLHLRGAVELADPRVDGSESFLTGLLAPVRSGIFLARADLSRCAAETGLGLRLGERRFALRALFSQEPERMLEWLTIEAAGWRDRHARWAPELGPVASFWSLRARHTCDLVGSLREGNVPILADRNRTRSETEVASDARD